MTFAQFKRMKPKYRMRLLLVIAMAFVLCIGLLYAVRVGVEALRVSLVTTQVKDVSVAQVLEKDSMDRILEAIGPSDPENLFVLDSALTCDGSGKVLSLEMHLADLVDERQTDYWLLTAQKNRVRVRKEKTAYDNLNSLRLRKVEIKKYYPALSRVPIDYLLAESPVGEGGSYLFADTFDNNRDPAFTAYLDQGLTGLWVSETGAVSSFPSTFIPPDLCAPTIVTVNEVDPVKSKKRKTVLLPAQEKYVVLLKCAPYATP